MIFPIIFFSYEFNSYVPGEYLEIGKVDSYYDGLNIKFDIHKDLLCGSSLFRGAMVFITPYGDDLQYLSKSHPITLKTGEATSIKLTEKQVCLFQIQILTIRHIAKIVKGIKLYGHIIFHEWINTY